tara:strand:- start:100 stop:477 length:378 start_codon:yes stop_codon:yes gene_type:complete
MYKFLFLFLMLGATSVVYKSFERAYLSQTVIARVTLKTNCELDPKAFAVKNITSGEVREFQHGEAFIKATLADELMVVLSEKFDQVSFEGEVVPVKQKLEIFQDCRKPVGIDGIFRSFNEQFAAK